MKIEPSKLKVSFGTGHEEGTELAQIIEPSEINIPAIQLGKRLEPYRPLWYEEPVSPENIGELTEVRSRVNIPIAAGRSCYRCPGRAVSPPGEDGGMKG